MVDASPGRVWVAASTAIPAVAGLLSGVPFVGFILPAATTYAAGAISHAIISTVRKNVDPTFEDGQVEK